MDIEKQIASSYNDPNALVITGRLQHEIAATALGHAGLAPALEAQLWDTLDSHQRILGGSQDETLSGLHSRFSGEVAHPIREALLAGLGSLAADHGVAEGDRLSAATLHDILSSQTPNTDRPQ